MARDEHRGAHVSAKDAVSDRRDVLKTGLAVLGGAAGLSVLVGPSTAAAAATMRLAADRVVGHVTGRQLDESPQIGDQIITAGRILGGSGNGIGEFHAICTLLALPTAFDRPHVTKLEHHAIQLQNGSIFGTGTTDANGIGVFGVTGGTGRYAGSRGSYRFVQSVEGLGGNGTASFVLTLLG